MASWARSYEDYNGTAIYTATLSSGDASSDNLVIPWFADKTIQVFGTFGGGTVSLQGACHPTNMSYGALTDIFGNSLAAIADSRCWVIAANPYSLKAVLTGGSAINVAIVGRYRRG